MLLVGLEGTLPRARAQGSLLRLLARHGCVGGTRHEAGNETFGFLNSSARTDLGSRGAFGALPAPAPRPCHAQALPGVTEPALPGFYMNGKETETGMGEPACAGSAESEGVRGQQCWLVWGAWVRVKELWEEVLIKTRRAA